MGIRYADRRARLAMTDPTGPGTDQKETTMNGNGRTRFNRGAMPQQGFTLIEMLIAIAVLAVISVAAIGVSVGMVSRVSTDTKQRQAEATTAQWVASRFTRDVQGMSGVAPECAPGTGSRLVTLEPSGPDPVIEYRVTSSDSGYGLERVTCGDAKASIRLAHDLSFRPSVSCDGGECVQNTSPRVVEITIRRSEDFEFTLNGVRRTSDVRIATPLPALVSLGGDQPLSVTGAARLNVTGDVFLNNPAATAASITGSGTMSVSGDLLVQQGSPPGSALRVTGAARVSVSGNGPAPADITTTGSARVDINGHERSTPTSGIEDPLRLLPTPDTSTMPTITSCPLQGGYNMCKPGIYRGPATFPPDENGNSGGGVRKFRLAPGVYVLRKGFAAGASITVESDGGVMFFIESGSVTINGAAKVHLEPQTSGAHGGIIFFQPATNTSRFSITASGDVKAIDGTIYAPGATAVDLASGAGTLSIQQVIGRNVSITGSGSVTIGGN